MSDQYISYPPPRTASGVTSLNSESGDINIVAGTGIAVVPAGQNITISNTNVLPGGSVLSGTYDGDVIVEGDASVGADTTVYGDLIINGNFTNTGGFALTVGGEGTISGNFSFTPSSPATAQSNVTFGGSLTLSGLVGGTHDFKVNPGQSPRLNIGGDLIGGDFQSHTFDGSANAAGAGTLTINCNNITNFIVTLNGADSDGSVDATPGGRFVPINAWYCSFIAKGGSSAFAGFSPAAGGQFKVFGEWVLSGATNDVSGGSATVTGTGSGGVGADAGYFQVLGNIDFNNTNGPAPLVAAGGNGYDGNGGAGGQVMANTFFGLGNGGSINVAGGSSTSASPGANGTVTTVEAFQAAKLTTPTYVVSPSELDAGNSGTTRSWDLSQNTVFTTTLDNNCAITLLNPVAGGVYLFELTQGASGGPFTVTFPGSTVTWAGGNNTLSTAANAIDTITAVYIGATNTYRLSLATNFS